MCNQSAGAILNQAINAAGLSRTPWNERDAILAATNVQKDPNHATKLSRGYGSIVNELRRLKDKPGADRERAIAKAFFGNIPYTAEMPEVIAL